MIRKRPRSCSGFGKASLIAATSDYGVFGQPDPASLPGLSDWAAARDVDAVIWTDLPPKFQGEEGRIPSIGEAAYLNGLPDEPRAAAIEYIRNAPAQIDTAYRRELALLVPATAP
ncbi:hypothetical protein WGT02_16365 [Rhizobium sp. T1470]|uniref:hypothetical protein n=1 Tax=unclassified Rhizobium TaxID=2613769 RepID=UPI001AAE8727|nr:hypothetical protein [Rhizobium sp. T1473]MCA0802766.1 hypothetical protein [Rhizobium sp. T1473]